MPILRPRGAQKLVIAATAFALVFSQNAPALAYGPSNAFGGRNDVRAMGYFHIPLGAPQAGKERAPSLGLRLQRQFQFNDPLYDTFLGSYRNSTNLTVDVMDLRFEMNGKLSGFDVGGFNAPQASRRLSAAANGDEGVPNWVWWVVGVPIVVVGGLLLLHKATCGGPSEIEC